jgi:hypothetical protein
MPPKKIIHRMKLCVLLAVLTTLTMACASQTQFLNDKQGMAMDTALTRGQTDLSCQQLSPTLISREVGWPSQQGTWVQGIYRAEFTISVEGCGKSYIYRMICPDGDIRCYEVSPSGLTDQGLKY